MKVSSFLSAVRDRGQRWLKKQQEPKPLRGLNQDLALVRRVKGQWFPSWGQLRQIKRFLTPWEKQWLRLCLIGVVVGFVWVGVNAVKAHRQTVPAVGGRYTEAVVGSLQFVNPLFASLNDIDGDLVRLMYSSLLRADTAGTLRPDLATSYEISPDKKTYTFHLRPGVVWHDDEPFTARDVLFTIETIQNPVVNSPLGSAFQGVKVDSPDDRTIVFHLKEPFGPFLASVGTVGILPEHVWFDVPPERMSLHKKNLQPIGTGSFQFSRLIKDQTGYISSYELKRFNHYYGSPSWINEFVFQFFTDYDTGGAALGDAGAIPALRGQRVDGLQFVPRDLKDKVARKHIVLYTAPLPQYTALFLNADSPALKDKKLRLALSLAIDKDRILQDAIRGSGTVAIGPILPGFPGYDAVASSSLYAVAEANRLLDKDWPQLPREEYRSQRREELEKLLEAQFLAEASASSTTSTNQGNISTTSLHDRAVAEAALRSDQELPATQAFYRRGADKDHPLLALTLVTADTPEYHHVAELTRQFWAAIGVATTVQYVEPKEIIRQVLKDRQYDALLYGFIIGSDPDQFAFWHSSQIDFPGLNVARYANKKVDDLLEKARQATDAAIVADLYKQFQEIILADRPAIFLYSPTYIYAASDAIQGIVVNRIAYPADRFANVTDWFIKTRGEWHW